MADRKQDEKATVEFESAYFAATIAPSISRGTPISSRAASSSSFDIFAGLPGIF